MATHRKDKAKLQPLIVSFRAFDLDVDLEIKSSLSPLMRLQDPDLSRFDEVPTYGKPIQIFQDGVAYSLRKNYGLISVFHEICIDGKVFLSCQEIRPLKWLFLELILVKDVEKWIKNLQSYTERICNAR